MALEHASVELCEKETNAEAGRLFIVLVNETDREVGAQNAGRANLRRIDPISRTIFSPESSQNK